MSKKEQKSALKVNKGIEQPEPLNTELLNIYKEKKIKLLSSDDYVEGILKGQIKILSQAITLVESSLKEHQQTAELIVEKCLPYSGKSIRIGITGVPGVGKSTFIEALGKHVTNQQKKLAVLAIDPSSRRSKGSILGDKTRMEELSTDPNTFIRPSPSAGSLGGVARKTREAVVLCEAAGYDVIFIETVGVGQSETTVRDMVDFFLLLMLAGAGDELQGIKRGIMEMADLIAINKADGDNYRKALLAKAEYENALHLFPPTDSGWKPKVEVCSALTKFGIDKIWGIICAYKKYSKERSFFTENRMQQQKKCLHETIAQELVDKLYHDKKIADMISDYEDALLKSKLSPYKAARSVLETFYINVTK